MAKEHRSGNTHNTRMFELSAESTLNELRDHVFDNEGRMHRLIEANIEKLFPGMTFLTREFREMAGGELRPDTVAFDTDLNTFVALEYKNKRNAEVVDQARAYLNSMEKHKADLVLLYNKKGDNSRQKNSFSWGKMYAIIMAPELDDYQIPGAEKDSTVELYKIRLYDKHVMLMERVGGGHVRTWTAAKRKKSTPDTNRWATAPRPIRPDGDVKLPNIEYAKGMRHPKELTCPDGSRIELKSWVDILSGVANWLVSKDHLNESHCPVPIGSKNAILNTQPIHQNGRAFTAKREAGKLFLNTDLGSTEARIRQSISLINRAGLDPFGFVLFFGDSARPVISHISPARVTITEGSSVPGCEEAERCYVPHTITVDVGVEVVWTNDDVAAHTVTSGVLTEGGPDGMFDSGLFAPGAKFSHIFEEVGEYPYFDLVHPWMSGMVKVKGV